jgi:hypothetical protein
LGSVPSKSWRQKNCTGINKLSRINSNKTEHSTLARELPRQCLSPPLLGIALKTIKTMAFLEPLLELLRLQQCYQIVHGFGSLHLLSQDEKKTNIKMNIMIMMMMMMVWWR